MSTERKQGFAKIDCFENFPQKHEKAAYQETIDFLVKYWIDLPVKPTSIYQIGEVSAPGISDIDLILVFDGRSKIEWCRYEPTNFPASVSNLLTHPPICCTQESLGKINGWFPAFDFRLVWGKDVGIKTREFSPGMALGYLTDYLITKMPVDLFRFVVDGTASARDLLLLLNSNKYIVHLADTAQIQSPDWAQSAIDEVTRLRNGWFSRTQSENQKLLHNCFEEHLLLNQKMLLSLTDQFRKIKPLQEHQSTAFTDGYWTFEFIDDWSLSKAYKCFKQSMQTHRKPTWQVPCELTSILSAYGSHCRPFRTHFNLKSKCNDLMNTHWNDGLKEHSEAMISYAVSSTRLGVPLQKYISYGLWYERSLVRKVKNRTANLLRQLVS